MLQDYADFCYEQIGTYVLGYESSFDFMRPKLKKANTGTSLPEYMSAAAFSSMVLSLFSFLLMAVLLGLTLGAVSLLVAPFISLVVGLLTLGIFYLYPDLVISSRASKINDMLPFATVYLSTLAGTGTPVSQMFLSLSQRDEYGQVAEEAERISRDLQTFNMDSAEALRRAAERTPSQDFSDLMYGMIHAINTGGELRTFLEERSDKLITDYERRVEEFSEKLSLLIEMYITVVILGSITFTSLSVVFSTVADPPTLVTVQVLAIFFGLPMISGMFILLVQGISPGGID
jgi:flagellar protein FlaJ